MRKVYNFNAGPAMLPEEVLEKAQAELLDWHQTGMSVMEIGHRGEHFKQIAEAAERDLRELMAIPANYKVLFLSGGATTQFAMVPLNLLGKHEVVDYVNTGTWSRKAHAEAARYTHAHVPAETVQTPEGIAIPAQQEWQLSADAAYLHYTPNETIEGVQFHWVPKVKAPLVADMTSMILSCPVNVQDFGIIYAGTQKNMGFAGLTIVIIREDLIHEPLAHTPTLYSYKIQAENQCFYNTPATYNWYVSGLIFQWMKEKGGLAPFYALTERKAKTLYACIDQYPQMYDCRIAPACRSLINVMFYLRKDELTATFLSEAKKIGLVNLRGHRVSGGVRASLYNAMELVAVEKLANFMQDFAQKHA
jgi:phosphoserine aminotransferase